MSLEQARAIEHQKYELAYQSAIYAMGSGRMTDALGDLVSLPCRGSYLDVSCGRGEMLTHAERMGFGPVQGTEIVPGLIDGRRVIRAEVHALPFADRSFDVVTMFDVIEHLIPGDDEMACRELERVARKHIVLSANNLPSRGLGGVELHINRRHYDEWDALFRSWFSGKVTWSSKGRKHFSETWLVDLS